jgi:undecaprenyl-diphosphatase
VNTLIQAIITGLLQGILEWLPVSSEGNLVIVLTSLFGVQAEETLNTAIFLHIGTGLAALVYFRSEVLKIIFTEIEEYSNFRSKLFVITMLTGLVGFPIFRWLNISVIYGEMLLAITGIALILTGLLQRQASNHKQAGFELSWPLSIALGAAQGLSIDEYPHKLCSSVWIDAC